ncbi:MAG TPA: IclR family transcriptional regulator C-terminal domain-containing protein [Pseudonocardiaceae bacterium]|nr:IclR family transcriptional regulator C-terminal domain-containing protein [Pseudonocardiaceae bacterium]
MTDPDRLRQELQTGARPRLGAQRRGTQPGVRAIAVPIRHDGATVAGALAVQGPTIRLTDDRLPALAVDLKTAAARIAPLLTADPMRLFKGMSWSPKWCAG